MKTKATGAVLAAAAFALIGPIAAAQNVEEVTVQGTRVMTTEAAGRTSTGIPLVDVSLSYGVSVADLDLASQYGPIALEKRVRDAALAACKEIGRQYPHSTPSDEDCAKAAADKAMVKVHELVAEARKKLPQ
ncbi:MAG: UrcA family protein [Steroidobacteraceae bacterium]